jgi:hypothetical protein
VKTEATRAVVESNGAASFKVVNGSIDKPSGLLGPLLESESRLSDKVSRFRKHSIVGGFV